MDMININVGDNINKLIGNVDFESPVPVMVGKEFGLLRDINNNQAELLISHNIQDATMAYIQLDNYKVLSTKLVVPNSSDIYKFGSELETKLRTAQIEYGIIIDPIKMGASMTINYDVLL